MESPSSTLGEVQEVSRRYLPATPPSAFDKVQNHRISCLPSQDAISVSHDPIPIAPTTASATMSGALIQSHRPPHQPLTPAATPLKRKHGDVIGPSSVADEPDERPLKRRLFSGAAAFRSKPLLTQRRSLFQNIPSWSIVARRWATKGSKLTSLELKRVTEAILYQVDWNEIGLYVGSNRASGIYRSAIKDHLQYRIFELAEEEGVYAESSPS